MKRQATVFISGIAAMAVACIIAFAPSSAAQVGVEKKVLLKQDLAIPGYEIVQIEVNFAAGGREGRHSHAGTLVGHVIEGELAMTFDGKPTKNLKAGESFLIEAQQVHEGINKGSTPVKVLATFVIEKSKTLTTPAP